MNEVVEWKVEKRGALRCDTIQHFHWIGNYSECRLQSCVTYCYAKNIKQARGSIEANESDKHSIVVGDLNVTENNWNGNKWRGRRETGGVSSVSFESVFWVIICCSVKTKVLKAVKAFQIKQLKN